MSKNIMPPNLEPALCSVFKDVPVAFFRDVNTGILYITFHNFKLMAERLHAGSMIEETLTTVCYRYDNCILHYENGMFISEYVLFAIYEGIYPEYNVLRDWLWKEFSKYRELYSVREVEFPRITDLTLKSWESSGIPAEKLRQMQRPGREVDNVK